MKNCIFALTLLISSTSLAADKSFDVDRNHTMLGFTAHTVLFDVQGRFPVYKVKISGEPETGKNAKIRIEMDVRALDTENEKRDDHLKSADFFDAETYPKVVFDGKMVKVDGNKVQVDGALTIRNVTKDVSIPFTVVEAVNGAGYKETVYKGTVKVSNKAFGVGNDSVGAKISLQDETDLNLLLAGFWEDMPAPAAAAAPPEQQMRAAMDNGVTPQKGVASATSTKKKK